MDKLEKIDREMDWRTSDPYQHPGVPPYCTCINPIVSKMYSRDRTQYYCNSCRKEVEIQKEIKTMPERLSDENRKRTETVGHALEGGRGQDKS